MAVRLVDGNAVKRRAWDIADAWKRQGRDYETLLLESTVEQIVDTTPTPTLPNEPRMINADKLAKRIAGHSNYHGNSILAAIYCVAEGKENDAPIRPIETPPNEWMSRVQELDELYTKLQTVTGFTAEQLLEIFKAGYTLEKPDYSKSFEEMARLAETIPPNEPLTCDGCYWQTHGSFGQCFRCFREKTDNYRRLPEGEEDT